MTAIGRIRLDPGPLRFFLAREPIVVASAGIRGGKTHTGALKALAHYLQNPTAPDEFHVIASPTFPMSRVPQEKLFRLLFDRAIFPVSPLIRYWKAARVFELAANGGISRVMIVTASDPDRWRGFKWRSGWLDEGAYMTEYAWEVAQGRLVDSAGPAWITTTPAGHNWIFTLYERARDGDETIRFVHWRTADNSHIPKDALPRLARNLDSQTAEQELGGLFIRQGGRVYHAFTKAKNVAPGRLNPQAELLVGMDFNVNPMSAVLAQTFTTREGLEGIHVIGEHYIEDGDTYKMTEWLRAFCKSRGIVRSRVTVYPDASGKARSTSGKSDHKIIRESGFRIDAPRANPPVRDRVNVVNGLASPMLLRFPRLLVDPECVVLLEALEKQGRDPKTGEPDKTKGFDHPVDALGYLAHERYPLRQQTRLAA